MNRKTPPALMAEDCLSSLERLWKYANYFAVNLGVRAGPDLHLAENRATLCAVLGSLRGAQAVLARISVLYRPLLVKVDRHRGDTAALLSSVQEFGFDGLILSGIMGRGEER